VLVNKRQKQSFTPVIMGHEVQQHLQGKQEIAGFWIRRGFTFFLEAGCDVLAWKVDQRRFTEEFLEFSWWNVKLFGRWHPQFANGFKLSKE
jgi:hypothetical protein